MQLQRLCYKLLKKIFITGLFIVATVPHDSRKRYTPAKNVGTAVISTSLIEMAKSSFALNADITSTPISVQQKLFVIGREKLVRGPGRETGRSRLNAQEISSRSFEQT